MYAGNLGELREIVFILQKICNDTDFAKLAYNIDTEDPLNKDLPNGKTGYDLLMYEKVFPYLKIIDIDEDSNVFIDVYFGKSINSSGSRDSKQNFLYLDVNVHQNLWKIDNGIRTYELMIRIDTLLNQTKIDNISSRFSFVDFRALPNPNPKYAGFGLIYQKHDWGVKSNHDWDN